MAKLCFISPTYGPVDPLIIRHHRAVIMHAAANGHTWVGDASPDRMKFDAARNAAARGAIDSGADYAVWFDSDILPPNDCVTRMLSYGHDFVTGMYFQREGNNMWPLIANYYADKDSFSWLATWPENVLAPIDGCGFGCVITSVHMLRRIEEEGLAKGDSSWFNYRKFSEDFDFCMRAREAGFQLYVDTAVKCGHMGRPTVVTVDDYKKAHPTFFEGGK
jgi:hypothetical protein